MNVKLNYYWNTKFFQLYVEACHPQGYCYQAYQTDLRGVTSILSTIDTNECKNGEATCSKNTVCRNTVGSYDCYCKKGFEKKGSRCVGKEAHLKKIHFHFISHI